MTRPDQSLLAEDLAAITGTTLPAAVEPLIGASGLAIRALVAEENRPPTLAACFDLVAQHPAVPTPFREEAAVTRRLIERLTGHAAFDLPADPPALRPFLSTIRLKQHATGNKRWNAFAVLQSTLILAGWVCPEAKLRYKLPARWEERLIAADRHGRRRALAAFVRYCHRRGLDLPDVTSATLTEYVDWLARCTLDRDPWGSGIHVQVAWRFMQACDSAWPTSELRRPPRRTSPFAGRADLRRESLVGASSLANRSLITGNAARPANLAAYLEFVVAHPEVPDRFRRDAKGIVATLARVTGQVVTALPADPVALRPILAPVQPIQFRLSNKRWRNILAVVRSTLILCGWLSADARKRYVLPPPWADLLVFATAHQMDRALAPFFRFCHRLGLTPHTITTDTLHAYIDWLTRSTLEPVPWHTARRVQESWVRMQRLEPAWPATEISLPSRRVCKRRNDFPQEFAADVAAYLDSLTRYHPQDPTYHHPLARASIRIVKASLLRAATFLAASETPVSAITGTATLVAPAAFQTILLAAYEEAGGWSVLANHMAQALLLAARRWVKPAEAVLQKLEDQCRCVRVRRSDRRRRQMLAQFATPEDRQALSHCPGAPSSRPISC